MHGQQQIEPLPPAQGVLWFLLPDIAPAEPIQWPKQVLAAKLPQPPKPRSYALIELSTYMCRYPLTAAKPHRFCGHTTADGSSYCATHHAVAYSFVKTFDDWMAEKLPSSW